MAKNKVNITGVDTSKLITINKEELMNLLILYHKGKKEVFNKLVEGNYKLVLSIVQKYNNRKDIKGYCWDKSKNKYIVRYKRKFYGRYVSEEEAEEAFKKACSGVEYEPQARRRYMLPKGVLYMKSMSKRGRPFYCRPQIKGKKYFLGYFKTPELALEAYHKLIKELGKED